MKLPKHPRNPFTRPLTEKAQYEGVKAYVKELTDYIKKLHDYLSWKFEEVDDSKLKVSDIVEREMNKPVTAQYFKEVVRDFQNQIDELKNSIQSKA